jgi:hypothetical protein
VSYLRVINPDEEDGGGEDLGKASYPRIARSDEPRGEAGKKKALPEGYQTFANKLLASVDPRERKVAKHVLYNTPKAEELYVLLRKDGMPETQIMRFYKHGINDIARGKGKNISPSAYTGAIAEEIASYGGYAEALKEMRKEDIISSRQYSEALHKMGSNVKDRTKRLSSALEELAEKEAAVWLFMAIGAILVLVSGFSMTGAVIGSTFDVSLLLILGIILFIMGLILKIKK